MHDASDAEAAGNDAASSTPLQDFQAIAEPALDAIVVIDRNGGVLFASPSALELAGRGAAEVIGHSAFGFVPPQEIERARSYREARRTGGHAPTRYETEILDARGRTIPVELTVSPISWLGTSADLLVIRDCEERRKAEAEIRRRSGIFEGITRAAHRFLHSTNLMDDLVGFLEYLGQAADVDRVFLWRFHKGPDGVTIAMDPRDWTAPNSGLKSPPEGPVRLEGSEWSTLLERLEMGVPLDIPLDEYPPRFAAWVRVHGIISLIAVPILLEKRLWGLLGFSAMRPRGPWSRLDLEALQLGGSILAGALRLEETARTLRESEEHYRLMMDQAFDAIYVTDSTGRYVDVNQPAADLVGYSREELMKLHVVDICLEEERAAASALFHRVVSGERILIPWRLRHKSGRPIPVEMSATSLADGFVHAIVRDTSERMRAEAELRRRDEILRYATFAAEAFLAAPMNVAVIEEFLERVARMADVGRVFIYENYMAADGTWISAYRHSWMAPAHRQNWRDLGPEFSWNAMGMADWIPRLRRGEYLRAPYEGQPDAAREALDRMGIRSLTVVPVHVDAELWGILGLADFERVRAWDAADLDAFRLAANFLGAMVRRRRIEQSLVDSEEKYRTLVEGAVQSIIMLDSDGVFRFVNRAAAERLGATVDEIVGRTVHEFFPPPFAEEQIRLVRKTLSSRTPLSFERRGAVRGVEKWFDARIAPITDADGTCSRAIVILSDITSRKAVEQELLATQERLRSMTWEVALTEQKERRRLAGELHDRIGHTLAFAKLKLGILRQAAGDGELLGAIDDVSLWVDEAIQATRTLTFELSPPVLYEIGLEAALEWLAERFGPRHALEVAFVDDGSAKSLSADSRGFLFHSVQELLVNVAKHAKARRVVIRTMVSEEFLIVSVDDDGVGFDPARVGMPGAAGGGYGLFSIRERLGSIGGSMEVRSSPDEGATVLLTLPLDPPESLS